MIIMKFGGTSVQDAAAINNAIEIIRGRISRRPVVVVSAMARVTDSLLEIATAVSARDYEKASSIIRLLRDRHRSTTAELIPADESHRRLRGSVEQKLDVLFNELETIALAAATLGELTNRTQDAIVSMGERLSSVVVAGALQAKSINAEMVDSRAFVVTDNHFTAAVPRMKETELKAREILQPLIDSHVTPVAQGFIGATVDGFTTTIGRGGSDYSAAIIGASLGAEAIEIWTDVDGLMTADPRVAPDARRIKIISFGEAAELSYFGAKVLHPSTVLPAVEKGIPVYIFNTHNPASGGTTIVAEPQPSRNLIKSIAFKRGVTIVNITSTRMLLAHGFLRTIFEVFDRYETSVDVVTTSEVSVSITLDNAERIEPIKRDLEGIGQVAVEKHKAIVCVVGNDLKFTPGLAGRVFGAVSGSNVNMISQGASEINLSFVIDESDVEQAVRLLHKEFFSELDPAVFA